MRTPTRSTRRRIYGAVWQSLQVWLRISAAGERCESTRLRCLCQPRERIFGDYFTTLVDVISWGVHGSLWICMEAFELNADLCKPTMRTRGPISSQCMRSLVRLRVEARELSSTSTQGSLELRAEAREFSSTGTYTCTSTSANTSSRQAGDQHQPQRILDTVLVGVFVVFVWLALTRRRTRRRTMPGSFQDPLGTRKRVTWMLAWCSSSDGHSRSRSRSNTSRSNTSRSRG